MLETRTITTKDQHTLKASAFESGHIILEFSNIGHYSSVHVTHDEALEFARKIHAAIGATE